MRNLQKYRFLISKIFISLDEHRLRAGWRLLLFALIFLFFTTLTSCAAAPVFFLLQENSNALIIISELVFFLAATLSVLFGRRFIDRRSIQSLGFKLDIKALHQFVFGFLLTAFLMLFVFLLEWSIGWLQFEGFAWKSSPLSEIIIGMLITLGFFIIGGWTEEILSRGYLLQNLEEGANLNWALFISSVVFATAHLANPNITWNAILGLFIAGYFLAYGYVRTRQLWLPLGLHIGWNFFLGTIFGFPVSGISDFPRLILHAVEGPEVWTGGSFGPEAGMIILPVILIGTICIWWYTGERGENTLGPNQ